MLFVSIFKVIESVVLKEKTSGDAGVRREETFLGIYLNRDLRRKWESGHPVQGKITVLRQGCRGGAASAEGRGWQEGSQDGSLS